MSPNRAHNDQREASQFSSVSSVRQIGLVRCPSETPRWFGHEPGGLFGFGVDLGVAVGGGEVGVSEPAADDVDLDLGFEEVHGGGVCRKVCGLTRRPVLGSSRLAAWRRTIL